jgi:hypothetical protein
MWYNSWHEKTDRYVRHCSVKASAGGEGIGLLRSAAALLHRSGAEARKDRGRFLDGRPVSVIAVQFLERYRLKLPTLDKRVLALIWDNASWSVACQSRAHG